MKYLIILSLLVLTGCQPKYDCMRMYYAGMDMEICSAKVKCIKTQDETGSLKTCHYEENR